ncbi:MAG: CRISPR-associated endoribonuclease Cas6 [Melioribacteraceae bacterium]|nr:CRISPR-associated endoribonuclease Cas6 [Melioribacteraceae bacterium]MDD3558708.1 CRISPR-associated endoribonuclease Cas6 [Melioribacteraceae bacterium]
MRLKLTLKAFRSDLITANYYHPFNAVVYNLLRIGSKEFASYLHDHGFEIDNKNYKLFSFALKFERIKMENDSIRLLSPNVTLIISSPLDEQFINNFVIGTFQSRIIDVKYDGYQTKLEPLQMEALPTPKFSTQHKFKCISPLVFSTVKLYDGKPSQYYLRYNDSKELINRLLNDNLKRKYNLLFGKPFRGEELDLNWDQNYIQRNNPKKFTRLAKIKADAESEVFYKGIVLPFSVKGSEELIKVGYDCGFGEKNSMGFGLAEIVN